MRQLLQTSTRGICKNIYCHKPLIGFDIGKQFCIMCRRNDRELKWICEECNYTVLSSTTSHLTKKICDGCLGAHTRRRNRNSYLKKAYRFTPEDQRLANVYMIEKSFRLFISQIESQRLCTYCNEPMFLVRGKKTKEFCSKCCKVKHHQKISVFIRQSLRALEYHLGETNNAQW
jgi:hypothetical protein